MRRVIEPHELETIAYGFLKKNAGKRFTVRQIYMILKDKNRINCAYPTLLKYVDILVAKKRIKIQDFGAVKSIWVEDEQRK